MSALNYRIVYTGSSKVIRRICERLNLVPILGTRHEDAYYGDQGEEAYQHSLLREGNPHNVTLDDLGIGDILNQIQALMMASGNYDFWIVSVSGEDDDVVTDDTDDELYFSFVEDALIWS